MWAIGANMFYDRGKEEQMDLYAFQQMLKHSQALIRNRNSTANTHTSTLLSKQAALSSPQWFGNFTTYSIILISQHTVKIASVYLDT